MSKDGENKEEEEILRVDGERRGREKKIYIYIIIHIFRDRKIIII